MRTQVPPYHSHLTLIERTIVGKKPRVFFIMPSANQTTAPDVRRFVHSLNTLLKCARLYGLHHHRSDEQFENTWNELNAAVRDSESSGLMLGASGGELVLNGEILSSAPAELSLAQILASAGIASVVFTGDLLQDSFLDFVKIFARSAQKPSQRLQALKRSFEAQPERGIRINPVRFVPAHSINDRQPRNWLRDPVELARMIGTEPALSRTRRFSSFDFGEELLGDFREAPSNRPVTEKESQQLIELLTKLRLQTEDETPVRDEWQLQFDSVPPDPKAVLREALSALASVGVNRLDDLALVRLSHDVAIRCATELFESGAITPRGVRPFLGGLCQITSRLATAPSRDAAEGKASIEAQTETLERQFWASAPEDLKQKVLLSSESWCVPPKNVQQSVKELQHCGSKGAAERILRQYAGCISSAHTEARKRTASGLNQLADLYTNFGGAPLSEVVRVIGEQLHRERDAETQSLLSSAFLKLSRNASEHREFPALRQMLASLTGMEKARPNWTLGLRPRIGFDNRIPEFIEDGLKSATLPNDFIEVMRRVPQAADHLAGRLMKVTHTSERERIVQMARAIGEPLKTRLRETLELAPPAKAVRVAGLLSRLDPSATAQLLPQRLAPGASHRETHDEVLHQLSIAGAPERGQMLMSTLERFDSMIVPMALDEIGMCGDASVASELLRVANGQSLPQSSEFVRVKAIEALGRLRVPEIEAHLLRFVEQKKVWRWAYPAEMRLAAAQALTKLSSERARILLSDAGLDSKAMSLAPLDARTDRDFVRCRRYQRVRMINPLPAVVQSSRGKCQPDVQILSLEGGFLTGNLRLATGSPASLRISTGLRAIHLDVLVRFTRPNQAGVEMVGMDLEDRTRLRSLLVSMAPSTLQSHRALVPA